MQVRSSEPADLGLIQVSCPVRQAMAIQVALTNPTDKPLPLKVMYSTQSVVGPSSFIAPPGGPCTFECFYTPLLVGAEEGSLRLISNEVGVAHKRCCQGGGAWVMQVPQHLLLVLLGPQLALSGSS
jgi:hypothetical protein